MSVLKNDGKLKLRRRISKPIYEIPAVIRKSKEEVSFEKSLIIALIAHPVIILFLLFVVLVLKFLGIDFDMLKKPDLKPKDIEFVLVEKQGTPIDKNTKYRADKDSQAGGIHDKKRPVSLPKAAAPKVKEQKPKQKTPPQKKVEPKKVQQPVQKKVEQKPVVQKPVEQQKPTPKAPAPKPTPTPVVQKPTVKPLSDFNIPIPKSSIPQMAQPTSSPVTSAPSSSGMTGKSTTPSPSFSPTQGSSGSAGGRFSAQGGSGTSTGNVGNPGPGNPYGSPGIDAIREPDFGPYMKDLQRRIKMNWDPPKGDQSKRVVLLFTISRDGRLLNVSVYKSSGQTSADNAAINAVKLTAPFRPLPPEFKGNSVDIQFTFDYNVLGASMY